eukprot:Opistho-2@75616
MGILLGCVAGSAFAAVLYTCTRAAMCAVSSLTRTLTRRGGKRGFVVAIPGLCVSSAALLLAILGVDIPVVAIFVSAGMFLAASLAPMDALGEMQPFFSALPSLVCTTATLCLFSVAGYSAALAKSLVDSSVPRPPRMDAWTAIANGSNGGGVDGADALGSGRGLMSFVVCGSAWAVLWPVVAHRVARSRRRQRGTAVICGVLCILSASLGIVRVYRLLYVASLLCLLTLGTALL